MHYFSSLQIQYISNNLCWHQWFGCHFTLVLCCGLLIWVPYCLLGEAAFYNLLSANFQPEITP
jgi:hypothetical protein